jgi:hypothetical protein
VHLDGLDGEGGGRIHHTPGPTLVAFASLYSEKSLQIRPLSP